MLLIHCTNTVASTVKASVSSSSFVQQIVSTVRLELHLVIAVLFFPPSITVKHQHLLSFEVLVPVTSNMNLAAPMLSHTCRDFAFLSMKGRS